MQEENRPTNLIYFHTDLKLALDQIGYHPSAPAFCPFPLLSALWQGLLPLHTLSAECQGLYRVAGKDRVRDHTLRQEGPSRGPQKDCSLPWEDKELWCPTVLFIWKEHGEEASWFHGLLEVPTEEGEEAFMEWYSFVFGGC